MSKVRFDCKISQVMVTKEMKAEIERIAQKWQLRISDIVRLALADFIQQHSDNVKDEDSESIQDGIGPKQ